MIEEEEWIDYRKRSTDEVMEKMENAKIKTHKRMKWETGAENSINTE